MNDDIKNYFTEEVRARVREMTAEDMKNHLKAFEGTDFWFAMMKYSQDRIGVIQDSFLTMDPVKEPSKISQYQGIITGLLDFQDAVLNLKFDSKKKENPKYKEEQEKEHAGGNYGIV